MNLKRFKWLCIVPALVSTTGFAQNNSTIDVVPYQAPVVSDMSFSSSLKSADIKKVADQVADWQLSQFDIRSNMMRREGRASGIPQGWMYATFDIGLLAWADVTKQNEYKQATINMAKLNDWTLGPRVYHADDHAIGSVYIDLYEQDGDKSKIAHLTSMFDQVLAAPKNTSLLFDDDKKFKEVANGRVFHDPICTVRWCWADAIFMAPPVWTKLAVLTGNNEYLDFMNQEFWATTEYLFNTDEQLYLRDSRYFDRKDSKGRLIYWGRGNGWVLAGIARVLEAMPLDYQHRQKYVDLYTSMSDRLIKLQQKDGSWPSSLLETETNSTPESSGTGLLIYAMAWGVNNGILPKTQTNLKAIDLGWQSLVDSVQPNGKLGWVQQVAFAPGSATKDDTQLYGTGALLLAAAEVYKLVNTEQK
ncbi:glycoside hydrolase family 88 protein [Psychrosphaera sp. F3M07]|jgi:rhamnogalacturonyl hydrolase YesR|uniref:glycoside hydrolase family 88/105 protein n=1 Tax=Psychrosphaera sp. F3M07 TaxID=2841560 RepID=UPI001C089FE1|nr:glycoside hydrolase family 88 protein [Psychrosphaera sp. F3M07]MBU2919390.1 glycoside hydrolase family 88 protein [Psychrosphaera sp. F3M07]